MFCTSLTSITIGNGVISIGSSAFSYCTSLYSVTIGNSVTSISDRAFWGCTRLTRAKFKGNIPPSVGISVFAAPSIIYRLYSATGWGDTFAGRPVELWTESGYTYKLNPDNTITFTGFMGDDAELTIPSTIEGVTVTSIGNGVSSNTSITAVTFASSITNIADNAFSYNTNLLSAVFQGNAPAAGSGVFAGSTNVTIYYRHGTEGWDTAFAGINTIMMPELIAPSITPEQMTLNIVGEDGMTFVVEVRTNLLGGAWVPIYTNTISGGSGSFEDADLDSIPSRFYRIIQY